MFDKFGEFDSWEEINKAAEGQKAEGDIEALKELAKENGICPEDVEDYLDNMIDTLCTPLTAAIGKLSIEKDRLKPKDIMQDWTDYIEGLCTEKTEMCIAVRKKGKSLKGCIAELLKWSYKNSHEIDDDIKKAAGINSANVKLGIPGVLNARKIIKEYYLGGTK